MNLNVFTKFPEDLTMLNAPYKNLNSFDLFNHNGKIYEFLYIKDPKFIDNNITYLTDNFYFYIKLKNKFNIKFFPFYKYSERWVMKEKYTPLENAIFFRNISEHQIEYLKNMYQLPTDLSLYHKNDTNYFKNLYFSFLNNKLERDTRFILPIIPLTDTIQILTQSYLFNTSYFKHIEDMCTWLGATVELDSVNNIIKILNLKNINNTKYELLFNGDENFIKNYIFGDLEINKNTLIDFMDEVYKLCF